MKNPINFVSCQSMAWYTMLKSVKYPTLIQNSIQYTEKRHFIFGKSYWEDKRGKFYSR